MFTEDLTAFFNVAEFANAATLNGVAVSGILDSGFEDPTLAGFGVVGSSPKFMLAATQPGLYEYLFGVGSEGRELIINSGSIGAGTYKVTHAYPDGTGIVVLHLISRIY